MKKLILNNSLLAMILAALMITTSCDKDEVDAPPVTGTQTEADGMVTTHTIAELNAMYTSGVYTITDDVVIAGVITSDDTEGNFYKVLVIQDETAAIQIRVDNGAMAADYPRGQKLFVKCQNLGIGEYGGALQLGAPTATQVDPISYDVAQEYHFFRSVKDQAVTPAVKTLDQLSAANMLQLIKLENVQFASSETGNTYADALNKQTMNRNMEDCNGNICVVRNSGYASFAGETLPTGNGSIVAIYSEYNGTKQLLIRDLDDVDMAGDRCGNGGGTGNGAGTFDDPYDIDGAKANYGTVGWVEGYMVGVYETVDANGATLDPFAPSFTSPFNTNSNMIIAPTAEETNISNCMIVQLPSGDIRNALNLVDNTGNKTKLVQVYGSFEDYFSSPGVKSLSGYWLDGAGINPDVPAEVVVIGTSTTGSSLNSTFDDMTENADYDQSGWLNANIKGERYWIGKTYDSNNYIQFSGYGATAADLEAWAITPGIDATAAQKLTFKTKDGYYKHDALTVYISTDFDGAATNVQTATWTQLTGMTFASGSTSGYADTWTESGNVDLSAYAGQKFYIMFKYVGDNSTNTTTMQLDDVVITDL